MKQRLASEFAVVEATDKAVVTSSGDAVGYVRLNAGIVQEQVLAEEGAQACRAPLCA